MDTTIAIVMIIDLHHTVKFALLILIMGLSLKKKIDEIRFDIVKLRKCYYK